MSDLGLSTIAQLLFRNEHSIDFARIVAELDGALSRFEEQDVQILWDCDDFVCFDIPGTRILLTWSEVGQVGFRGCLSISVGPGDHAARGGHEDLCSRLVDRICVRYDPMAVLWCQAEGKIGFDVIDHLVSRLPHLGKTLPDIDSVMPMLSAAEDRLTSGKAATKFRSKSGAGPMPAANDQPTASLQTSPELDRLRRALYAGADDATPYSTQMRLAAHCMNATLIVVWAPLGAALMTYSILRGENVRLSSRMMAVAGTVFALAHTPIGMSVAAMARSLV